MEGASNLMTSVRGQHKQLDHRELEGRPDARGRGIGVASAQQFPDTPGINSART
ncbi:hypothetical protein GCM10009780_42530 [Actinomadura alba]